MHKTAGNLRGWFFKFLAVGMLAISVQIAGCQIWRANDSVVDYRTVADSPLRDTVTAESKHREALTGIRTGNIPYAEQRLQQSLMADVSFGPAHNSLGKIYFDQKKYYLAAWEFEHAAKLMPHRPEPHNNLGLVYESVDRLPEAIVEYQFARDLDPENHEYLGNLLRARVRSGESATTLHQELKELLALDPRLSWQQWCRRQLATLDDHPQIIPISGNPSVLLEENPANSEPEVIPLPRPENRKK